MSAMKYRMTAGSDRIRARNQHLRDISGQTVSWIQLHSRGHVVRIKPRAPRMAEIRCTGLLPDTSNGNSHLLVALRLTIESLSVLAKVIERYVVGIVV